MRELLLLDAMAMALLNHDVVTVDDADLTAPTPCDGWVVADLIDHMNQRHSAFLAPKFMSQNDERRAEFARIAAHWVVAAEHFGDTVDLPGRGSIPAERLLSIHIVDMLVHRWDLRRALGLPCPTPSRLTAAALPMAISATADGTGFDGAYQARVQYDSDNPMDAIVALLGRNPGWGSAGAIMADESESAESPATPGS
ncbi:MULTISPECIES: maleylpyruvate isomerase family mycothiol-dependent enzyme [unclassified Nocardia]|uniref:maleylpyruvate isomerase family mycothiol-dependent enzyme n=1 Tax=unclassified Nocardia TaxID=2637762 RepID=UPI001CE3BAFF|nr:MULTISPECIES: maleylpyruvate isomerase family mycothiol-dependent enzyme [unclassified Nocardia]